MSAFNAILTGKTRSHLVALNEQHFLQPEVKKAFLALQQSAKEAGFDLQPASTFRDFSRQQKIWNGKFKGERKVHNDAGNTLNLTDFTSWQKCQAILRWSALPGASRHHWGTEIDIYDPLRLPQGQQLKLEPWEFAQGGYFYDLSQWLFQHAPKFGFGFPFVDLPKYYQIGREPWHLSYMPLANQLANALTEEVLLEAWQGEEIAGKSALLAHLDEFFHAYFVH